MPNNRVTDHDWHDIEYRGLPNWVKQRIKELKDRQLAGKTFRYRLHNTTGRYQRRLHDFVKADAPSKTAGQRSGSLHRKGLALGRQGKHKQALACFAEAINLNPEDNTAWHRQGIELNCLSRHEEAIASFDRAIAINWRDHFAWNHKAVALRELRRYDKALFCCDEAVRLSEGYPFGWYNRGLILSELGKHAEAKACYERAARLDPTRFNGQEPARRPPRVAKLKTLFERMPRIPRLHVVYLAVILILLVLALHVLSCIGTGLLVSLPPVIAGVAIAFVVQRIRHGQYLKRTSTIDIEAALSYHMDSEVISAFLGLMVASVEGFLIVWGLQPPLPEAWVLVLVWVFTAALFVVSIDWIARRLRDKLETAMDERAGIEKEKADIIEMIEKAMNQRGGHE